VVKYVIPSSASSVTVKLSDPHLKPTSIVQWENDETKVGPGAPAGQWNDFSNYPDEGISRRHGDGATIGNLDGSAGRMDMHDFWNLAGTPAGVTPNPPAPGEAAAVPSAPNDLWWF
jgi:hypothetical protein